MSANTEAKAQADLVEVTLKKPHTHAGKQYQPGDKLHIPSRKLAWFKAQALV